MTELVPLDQAAAGLEVDGAVYKVPIDQVVPDPENERQDLGDLRELTDSMRANGYLRFGAMELRPAPPGQFPDPVRFVIISGERRHAAATAAGLPYVLATVSAGLEDLETAVRRGLENIPRKALEPVEEAIYYRKLMEMYGLSQREVSRRLGVSQAGISNRLGLLALEPAITQMVQDGVVPPAAARHLSKLRLDGEKALDHDAIREVVTQTVTASPNGQASEDAILAAVTKRQAEAGMERSAAGRKAKPLDGLGLTPAVQDVLVRGEITEVRQLVSKTRAQLAELAGADEAVLDAIEQTLRAQGRRLAEPAPPPKKRQAPWAERAEIGVTATVPGWLYDRAIKNGLGRYKIKQIISETARRELLARLAEIAQDGSAPAATEEGKPPD